MRVFITLLMALFLCWPDSAMAGSENVVVESKLGPLAGTLLLPEAGLPKAVALIIAGSGPTDRNGNTPIFPGDNNNLKMLAEALAAAGIGSLRYDKRLIGESATTALTEADVRFDTYVDDAVLLLAYLGESFDVPIYIIGHSEGAHIALLAGGSSDVAGVVAIAGPGRPAGDLILEQVRPRLPANLMAETEKIIAELKAGRLVPSTPPELAALFRDSVQPYLISWFAHDPATAVEKIEKPVLLVYGSTDIQVPVSDGELLAAAGEHSELQVISGMNHVLKMVNGPDMQSQMHSYSESTLPISAQLLKSIVAFISSTTSGESRRTCARAADEKQ